MRRLAQIKQNKNFFIKDTYKEIKVFYKDSLVFYMSYKNCDNLEIKEYSNGILINYLYPENELGERNYFQCVEFYNNNGECVLNEKLILNSNNILNDVIVYKDIVVCQLKGKLEDIEIEYPILSMSDEMTM